MKFLPKALFLYVLMGMLTLGYTLIARLGLSVFNILYDPRNMGELPLVSRLTAHLNVIETWQVLAWSSFVISLAWGMWRYKKEVSAEPFMVPWICHLSWIIMSLFWNAVGAMTPLVSVAYRIS